MNLIWIALAGATGSVLRYGVAVAAGSLTRAWPAGTLAVNIVGSFVMGLVAAIAASGNLNETLRLTLVVGLIGGFTTYSAFNEEMLGLLRTGAWGTAALYLSVTVIGGLLAGAAGYAIAK